MRPPSRPPLPRGGTCCEVATSNPPPTKAALTTLGSPLILKRNGYGMKTCWLSRKLIKGDLFDFAHSRCDGGLEGWGSCSDKNCFDLMGTGVGRTLSLVGCGPHNSEARVKCSSTGWMDLWEALAWGLGWFGREEGFGRDFFARVGQNNFWTYWTEKD